MNPLITFTFPCGSPPTKLIIDRLSEKTGLPVLYDFYSREGPSTYYSQENFIFENNDIISKIRLSFEGVADYELKLYIDSTNLVMRRNYMPIIGYFEGCLVIVLKELGGNISPLGVHIPPYAHYNFEKARLMDEFTY